MQHVVIPPRPLLYLLCAALVASCNSYDEGLLDSVTRENGTTSQAAQGQSAAQGGSAGTLSASGTESDFGSDAATQVEAASRQEPGPECWRMWTATCGSMRAPSGRKAPPRA